MAQETRKGKRAPAALRVRFRADSVDEFIQQQAPNISSGGMFIKSKSPLARGTLMVFDFQLQDGSPLIKGVGRVVWARKPDAAGNEPPGMGLKFIRVEPESLPTFKKIMAGKRGAAEGPKDVVVQLGDEPLEGPEPTVTTKPVGVDEAAFNKGPEESDLRATPRVDLMPSELLEKSSQQEAPAEPEASPAPPEPAATPPAATPEPAPSPSPEPAPSPSPEPAPSPSPEPSPAAAAEPSPAAAAEPSPAAAAEASPQPEEPKPAGAPLSDLFDSSPPAEPARGDQPLPGATPVPTAEEPPTAATTSEPEPEKGSPVGLILGVLLVLLILAGVGGYFYLDSTGQLGLIGLGGGAGGPEQGAEQPTPPETPPPEPGTPEPTPPEPVPIAPTTDAAPATGDAAPAQSDAAAAQSDNAAAQTDVDAATGTRVLVITSEPTDVRTMINGYPSGRTPITRRGEDVEFDRGEILLMLSRVNHDNWTRTITPDDAGWQEVDGDLRLEVHAVLVRHHGNDDDGQEQRPQPSTESSSSEESESSGGTEEAEAAPNPAPAPDTSAATGDNPYEE